MGGQFQVHFSLGRRDITDRLEQPLMIEPVDPVQHRELDGGKVRSRPVVLTLTDDFRLEQADYSLGQRV